MRIKISRKEAKESAYWLRLIYETNSLKNAYDAQGWLQEANNWNLGFVCNLVLGIWCLFIIWCLRFGIFP
jgi:hypothetical protein